MSRQLTFAAALSTFALNTLVVVTMAAGPRGGDDSRAATAHGSIIGVLLRA